MTYLLIVMLPLYLVFGSGGVVAAGLFIVALLGFLGIVWIRDRRDSRK